MKKLNLGLLVTGLLLNINIHQSNAAAIAAPSSIVVSKNTESTENTANTMLVRLNEIKDMDKSDLKKSDKKKLRIEVLSIRDRFIAMHSGGGGGGVFISVGGLIVIILLLIIIF